MRGLTQIGNLFAAVLLGACTIETPSIVEALPEKTLEEVKKVVTKFRGTFAGSDTLSGAIDIYIAGAVTLPSAAPPLQSAATGISYSFDATGIADVIGGSAVALDGKYTNQDQAVNLAGSGYSMAVSLTAQGLVGSLWSPNGITAAVTAVIDDASKQARVLVFCGTWAGTSTDGVIGGTWNVVYPEGGKAFNGVSSGEVSGTNSFYGSVTANQVAISGPWGTAEGTISGETITGTWTGSDDSTGNGTWEGSTASCRK